MNPNLGHCQYCTFNGIKKYSVSFYGIVVGERNVIGSGSGLGSGLWNQKNDGEKWGGGVAEPRDSHFLPDDLLGFVINTLGASLGYMFALQARSKQGITS